MATLSVQTGRKRSSPQRILLDVLLYFVIALGGIITAFPFFWMLATAFKVPSETFAYPPTFIPQQVTFANFADVWSKVPFGRYIFNTAVVAICTTAAELVTASMAAYAFARLRFPGRDALFLLYLATLMIPGQVTLIPNFILMRILNGSNTYWGLILPAAFTAFGTFLLRQFFMSLPRELEDAAKIDGCNYLQLYTRIILPLSGPALATLGIFSFMGAWNSFLWPSVMINKPDMRTLTVALRSFQSVEAGVQWNLLMAGSTIAILPVLILFLLAQKYFVRGIALTGFGGR